MSPDPRSVATLHTQRALDCGEFGVRIPHAVPSQETASGPDQGQRGSCKGRRSRDYARQRHWRRFGELHHERRTGNYMNYALRGVP